LKLCAIYSGIEGMDHFLIVEYLDMNKNHTEHLDLGVGLEMSLFVAGVD